MKVYITGANGFIGRNLKEYLQAKGHEVFTYERGKSFCDIDKINPDYIFHCAAELRDEAKMMQSNIDLTYKLLEVSKDIDYKCFVYLGSSIEYGDKAKFISESDFLEPSTIYGATKAAGDLLCQAFAKKYNKPIKTIRLFSVFGRYEKPSRFIPTLFDKWQANEPITISEGVHDFAYIDDVIRFINLVAMNDTPNVLNFGTGIITSNIEVLHLFENIIGNKLNYELTKEKLREYDVRFCACDTTLISSLGFQFLYTLKEGLTSYVKERLA